MPSGTSAAVRPETFELEDLQNSPATQPTASTAASSNGGMPSPHNDNIAAKFIATVLLMLTGLQLKSMDIAAVYAEAFLSGGFHVGIVAYPGVLTDAARDLCC